MSVEMLKVKDAQEMAAKLREFEVAHLIQLREVAKTAPEVLMAHYEYSQDEINDLLNLSVAKIGSLLNTGNNRGVMKLRNPQLLKTLQGDSALDDLLLSLELDRS